MKEAIENLSFEQAYAELEATVSALEAETLDLEAMMQRYQRGRGLAEHCQQLLEAAVLQVQQLAPDGAGGYEVVPFDVGE